MAGMRRFARQALSEVPGYIHPAETVTPEDLIDHWQEIDASTDLEAMADTLSWVASNQARIDATPLAGG
jgi:hypothetical protein